METFSEGTWSPATLGPEGIELSGETVEAVRLTWPGALSGLLLGDAWERGYGDLAWLPPDPARVMPWFFLAHDGGRTTGYGVATGADAMWSWRVTGGEIVLEGDLRAVGAPWRHAGYLELPHVSHHQSEAGESAFTFARRFMRSLCDAPLMPREPVWGINDWYHAYGSSTRETILRDTRTLMELTPTQGSRPFSVIDMGWAEGYPPSHGGPQSEGNARFGDMARLAEEIRAIGARPGIWYRPLALVGPRDVPVLRELGGEVPGMWARDPSHPDVLARVHEEVSLLREWGYEMIKHDFTTFDVTGRWGFGMDARFTDDVMPHDDTRTTAAILKALYATIRDAAGPDVLLIGCNTVGHLTAGTHEISRTGDDTSGREWARTAKMGPNTLAMRMAQHGAFHAVDADCVAFTGRVDEEKDLQWLDLLSRSGTPLFVSASPEGLTSRVRGALREAYARAALPREVSEPLDWMERVDPLRWRHADGDATYDWA